MRNTLHCPAGVEEPQPSSAELAKFVRDALAENRARWRRAREDRRFLDPVFECLRILKAHAEFSDLPVEDATTLVQSLVPSFWNDLPSETSLGDTADPVSAFLDGWDSVQSPEGSESKLASLIRVAAERVAARPLSSKRFGPRLAKPLYAETRAFLALLEELQLEFGSESFPLPQKLAAEILGCEQTQISRRVRIAMRFGLLRRERKASRSHRRAAEYRFLSPHGSGSQVVE